MLDFEPERHEFTVSRVRYYLDPFDFLDATHVAALEGKTVPEQVETLRELMADKAGTDTPAWWLKLMRRKSPADAVRSLSTPQQARLFQAWMRGNASSMGLVVPGESSGSAS